LLVAALKAASGIPALISALAAGVRSDRRGRGWRRGWSGWKILDARVLLLEMSVMGDARRLLNGIPAAHSQSSVSSGCKAPTSHSHLEKIWIAGIGEGAGILGGLLACTGTRRAHVRRKGPPLFFVRHCCGESALGGVGGRSVGGTWEVRRMAK
jgi:hypothetical protein